MNGEEPQEVEGFNTLWNKFFNWYSRNKEGWMFKITKTKEDIAAFFQYRKRF